MHLIDRLAQAIRYDERACRAVFATATPEIVANVLEEHVEVTTSAHIAETFHIDIGDGALLGVALDDGRRVAVKAHGAAADAPHLFAAYALQQQLAEQSSIAAPILGAPRSVAGTVLVTMVWRADGRYVALRTPSHLRHVATTLHGIGTCFSGLTLPMGLGSDGVIASGLPAAQEVLARTDVGRHVVNHRALCPQAVRHQPTAMVAVVFDWHALGFIEEQACVARSAVAFSAMDGRAASAEEISLFVSAYERARGTPFADERRVRAHCAIALAAAGGSHFEVMRLMEDL